jgi:hypothetical protein
MKEEFQLYLVLQLHRRLLQWDSLAQVEFSVFQDLLREHGLFAISGNQACAIESIERDAEGNPVRLDFG